MPPPSPAALVSPDLIANMEAARVQTAQNKADAESAASTAAEDAADAVAALLASQVSQSATNATTAQTAASQAQGFRNDAQNYAAQANFAGYTGTFATKAAFGSPSGKPAGVYLVLADESHSGQPWAYFVISNAITASWGVVLQNATQGVDLLGPLVHRSPATNRMVMQVPRRLSSQADFNIAFGETPQPDGTVNRVMSMGHNIGPGGGKEDPNKPAHRFGMESRYVRENGQVWQEAHLGAYDERPGSPEYRYLSMEMDVDRTTGLDGKQLRLRLAADLFNVTDAEAQKVLVFITENGFSLQNRQGYDTTAYNGGVLQARQSDGQTFSVAGVYDSAWKAVAGGTTENITAVEVGEYKGMVQLARRVRIGSGSDPGTMLQIGSGGVEGVVELIRLKTQAGGVGDGVSINAYNPGDGFMGRLTFQIGPGGAGQARLHAGNTLALVAMQTGDVELPTAGAGLIQTTPGGARRRLVFNNDGTVSHVAA